MAAAAAVVQYITEELPTATPFCHFYSVLKVYFAP